jgi:hypothetical protein
MTKLIAIFRNFAKTLKNTKQNKKGRKKLTMVQIKQAEGKDRRKEEGSKKNERERNI